MYKLFQILKTLSIRERYIAAAAGGVFILSAILLGISFFYQKTVASPVEGGSYVEGIIGQPVSINPIIAGDNDTDRDLIALLFASLFDLAEKYETDPQQKVWTVTLKPDLKWSDGEPLTSDDIIFTISVVQDPDVRSPFFATWQGVLAERLSEREVRLTLKNPYAFFLDNIKNFRIAPSHIFDDIPPQNFRLSEYNFRPVGSGPYKVVNFEKRSDGFIEKYILTSNKYYALQKPFINNFPVKLFANKTDAINAFNAREIDGIGGLDQPDLENLKIKQQVFKIDRPRYYAIFFNQSTSVPLKEKEVRTALSQSVDKGKIVDTVLKGLGVAVNGPVPPTMSGYDPSIYGDNEFSLDKASTTLAKAGWVIGDDGIRTKNTPRGKIKLSLDIIVPEVPFLVDTVNVIKDDWLKIGVALNPIVLKPSEVINSAIKPRNYQMIIFGNTLNNNPDIFSFWHSSQRFDPGLNLALFNDKTSDGLLESLRQTLDETARLQDLSKLQKIINDQKSAIFLYSPQYLYVTSKNLNGFVAKMIAVPANRFEAVNGWYLKTARIFK
ncbi:MAG: Extracellular solute-binding protein [Parcubacteria group bacterium GW2011_GWA1_48_11b]|nr:MAG: Extracellular solute-binding protein [Parcubacteria group bacterium GW2011_GWA1_48_11b]